MIYHFDGRIAAGKPLPQGEMPEKYLSERLLASIFIIKKH
jgi:hypothetical protein